MRSGKDGSMVVRKHNELIEAKYKLTLNEQRLILNLITILTPDDDDFMDYTIQASDVALMFGVQDKDFYIKLQDAVKTLMNRTIDISKGNVVELVHWFSNIRYVRGSGKINVRFDKAIKPYLLQLKDHFTQYQIGAIAQFKSSYSVRFYELLKMKEFQGNGGQFYRIFPIEELRAYMQLEPTEYSVFQDLKKRVIVPALKEIDQHSDLSIVQVDYIKKGRSIDSIKITVDPKKQILMDMYEVKEPEQNDAIQELILFGIGEETAIKWAKKYGQERVMRNISYTLVMQQEGKVNSPQLYLSKAIQDDFGIQWEGQNKKKQEQLSQTKKVEYDKEQEEKRVLEQENKAFEKAISLFEGLDEMEQDVILDQVEQRLSNMEKVRFGIARKASFAHKERAYAYHFKSVFIENSFDLTI